MKHAFIVKDSIQIKASPEEVWKALTDPTLTRKYFFKSEVLSNWKRGSRIIWRRRFLWMKIELKGRITAIKKGKLLQYILKHSDKSGHSLITDKLSSKNGVTTLSVSDDVGSGAGAEKRYKRSARSWNKALRGLKKLLEKDRGEIPVRTASSAPA